MSPADRDFRDYLYDILDHARKLKSFVAGLSFETFQADEKTRKRLSSRLHRKRRFIALLRI